MAPLPTDLYSDQLSPHNIEAEQAVLGSILLNPSCMAEVLPFLEPQDFFIVRHGWVYAAILDLHQRSDPVDHLTVVTELEQSGKLAEIGGAAYIISLINQTPTALNVEGYGRIVQRMAIRRRLIEAAQIIVRVAHSDETEIEDVIDKAESALMDVVNTGHQRGARLLTDLLSEHYDKTMAVSRGQLNASGLKTGLIDLDELLGMNQGDLVILAAVTAMGKSALALNIAAHNIKAGVRVGMISYEMEAESLTTRMISIETGLDFKQITTAQFKGNGWESYTAATLDGELVHGGRFVIEDDPRKATLAGMRMAARGMAFEHGIQLLIVDYLQLMSVSDKDNRVEEISEITRGSKLLAKELHIPVVLISKLKRGIETRNDKRPLLSDLEGSGSIEHDADKIIFIYRDSYYKEDSPDGNRTELHLAKNRNGATGTADVMWMPESTRFVNATRQKIDLDDLMKVGGV